MTAVSQADYARHLGKSKQYVNKLVKQGKISVDAGGRIDVEQADAQLRAIADPARRLNDDANAVRGPVEGAGGVADDLPAPAGAPVEMSAYQRARTAREVIQAREAQRKHEESLGRLIDRASTEQAFEGFAMMVRQGLADRAADLAVSVAGLGGDHDRIAAAIEEADRRILAALADGFDARFGNGAASDAA